MDLEDNFYKIIFKWLDTQSTRSKNRRRKPLNEKSSNKIRLSSNPCNGSGRRCGSATRSGDLCKMKRMALNVNICRRSKYIHQQRIVIRRSCFWIFLFLPHFFPLPDFLLAIMSCIVAHAPYCRGLSAQILPPPSTCSSGCIRFRRTWPLFETAPLSAPHSNSSVGQWGEKMVHCCFRLVLKVKDEHNAVRTGVKCRPQRGGGRGRGEGGASSSALLRPTEATYDTGPTGEWELMDLVSRHLLAIVWRSQGSFWMKFKFSLQRWYGHVSFWLWPISRWLIRPPT